MRQGGHPIRNPCQPVAVPRKHFIGRNNIAINVISIDIDLAMGGMLDAINNDKAVRINCANYFGNRFYIHPHASYWRCVKDCCNTRVFINLFCVSLGWNQPGIIIMRDQHMGFATNRCPSCTCAPSCRMLNRWSEHNAIFGRAKAGIHDKTKNKLGPAFPNKELPGWCIHKDSQILLGLINHSH